MQIKLACPPKPTPISAIDLFFSGSNSFSISKKTLRYLSRVGEKVPYFENLNLFGLPNESISSMTFLSLQSSHPVLLFLPGILDLAELKRDREPQPKFHTFERN